MRCIDCKYEPVDTLLTSPCPNCGKEWLDTQDYVAALTRGMRVITVLDIGCGNKGVIAQHHWEYVKKIAHGYACDKWVIKPLPELWTPLKIDAEDLEAHLPTGVDFITHCGFLEHVRYEQALHILSIIERLARKRVFFSCSAELREVDYKVKRDGNPYHYYRSWWDGKAFELLGYTVDRARMRARQTFDEEVVGWFDPRTINVPWERRKELLKQHLTNRRCHVPGCEAEPIRWNVDEDVYCCLMHRLEKAGGKEHAKDVGKWADRPDIEELFFLSRPPWRPALKARP